MTECQRGGNKISVLRSEINMNTITHKFNGVTRINMSDHAIKGLRSYSPQGCSFIGYTLYDLLQDLINLYGWKIDRGYTMTITDFIKLLQKQKYTKAIVYGDDIIRLIER
jgi:hypothetical protein